jgi:hypothetical protein
MVGIGALKEDMPHVGRVGYHLGVQNLCGIEHVVGLIDGGDFGNVSAEDILVDVTVYRFKFTVLLPVVRE